MIEYIIIYVISLVGVYFGIHKTYSKGGPFSNTNPSFADLIFTFIPIVNTVFFVMYLFGWTIHKIDKTFHSGDFITNFFRIKK